MSDSFFVLLVIMIGMTISVPMIVFTYRKQRRVMAQRALDLTNRR